MRTPTLFAFTVLTGAALAAEPVSPKDAAAVLRDRLATIAKLDALAAAPGEGAADAKQRFDAMADATAKAVDTLRQAQKGKKFANRPPIVVVPARPGDAKDLATARDLVTSSVSGTSVLLASLPQERQTGKVPAFVGLLEIPEHGRVMGLQKPSAHAASMLVIVSTMLESNDQRDAAKQGLLEMAVRGLGNRWIDTMDGGPFSKPMKRLLSALKKDDVASVARALETVGKNGPTDEDWNRLANVLWARECHAAFGNGPMGAEVRRLANAIVDSPKNTKESVILLHLVDEQLEPLAQAEAVVGLYPPAADTGKPLYVIVSPRQAFALQGHLASIFGPSGVEVKLSARPEHLEELRRDTARLADIVKDLGAKR